MSRMIESTTVRTGRNAEHPSFDDAQYIKCWHCGFICHPQRDTRALNGTRAGDGIQASTGSYYAYENIIDITNYNDSSVEYDGEYADFEIIEGCPMCGCLTYDQERPNG